LLHHIRVRDENGNQDKRLITMGLGCGDNCRGGIGNIDDVGGAREIDSE
jgi:hypothetical protein